jgi:hypothetical protein
MVFRYTALRSMAPVPGPAMLHSLLGTLPYF